MDSGLGERRAVLSTLPAGRGERRLAFAVALVSLGVFAALAPFAQVKLRPVDAFIPIYQSALILNDLITAALLFGQFSIARSRALLVLACAYVFTALMTIAHTLSFPGLFAPAGLLGAGTQTTAWLYMFWHGIFPIAVIAYAVLIRSERQIQWPRWRAIAVFVAATVLAVAGLTALATAGQDFLPRIMRGNGYTPALIFVISSVWAFSCLALVVLWLRRPHSVLDVWLMVVMCAWLCDIALSAVLNAGRFDLGFYAGRIYGLLAASFVLVVLLSEVTTLYARLARAQVAERAQRERRLNESNALLAHFSRLSEIGQMAPALVHEMNQPLTAISNYLAAGRILMQTGQVDKAETVIERAIEQVHRAGQILIRLKSFLSKDDPERTVEEVRGVVDEANSLALMAAGSVEVDLRMDFEPGLPMVLIDKIQIQQVLLNLIRNAIEAMAPNPQRTVVIATKARADAVEISVADNGPGLAPQIRARLFQPFTSTKGSGMGVGLSICRAIIEAHGGKLWADDNDGGGTVFRFTLPAVEPRSNQTDSSAAA